MLALENLCKSYAGQVALAPTSLAIERGQIVVLVGQSGCGKSTLLRLVLGLVRPDAGHVTINGVRVGADTWRALRQKTGYVIQGGGLFPHLSARDNITLMARYSRWGAARIDARLHELVELTRFPAASLGRGVDELSGGQCQRVSLMRALMLDPDLLLMDEPLGALDPIIRAELQDELKSIFQRLRKTVVLVTHDLGEADFFADTILLMHEGRVLQNGSLSDLVHRPADPFVARFVRAQRPLRSEAPTL